MAFNNITLPDIQEKDLDSKAERKKIMEYLYSLSEQLRYMMDNIGTENLSQALQQTVEGASQAATSAAQTMKDAEGNIAIIKKSAKELSVRVLSAEDEIEAVEAEIFVQAGQIAAKVSHGESIVDINATQGELKIRADKIALEGLVTANEYFKILESGSIEAQHAKLSSVTIEHGAIIRSYQDYKIYLDDWAIFNRHMDNGYVEIDGNVIKNSHITLTDRTLEFDALYLNGSVIYEKGATGYIRAPRIVRGVTTVDASGTVGAINYSNAGFTTTPTVLATWMTTGGNQAGDWGALKVFNVSTTAANITAGGNHPTSGQTVAWVAIGW